MKVINQREQLVERAAQAGKGARMCETLWAMMLMNACPGQTLSSCCGRIKGASPFVDSEKRHLLHWATILSTARYLPCSGHLARTQSLPLSFSLPA